MQRVFVGYPFKGRFPSDDFQVIFRELPLVPDFGDEVPETSALEPLLSYLRSHISKADYTLFDVTYFNPNVLFELGLSAGLTRREIAPRILLNTKRSKAKDLPSDLHGVVRIEYESYDYESKGLGDRLMQHVFSKERWFRRLWPSVPRSGKERKKVLLALRILGHVKESRASISPEKIAQLAEELDLGGRQPAWHDVPKRLTEFRLLRKVKRGKGHIYRLGTRRFER